MGVVRKCYGELEIGRGSFLGKRDMSKDEASLVVMRSCDLTLSVNNHRKGFKLDSKSKKTITLLYVENNARGKIFFPYVNNISKKHNKLSTYGNHHLGILASASADKNSNAE
ncbi:hypothetical protein MtrunA17_Chr7g0220041 [Medicago truncatula]|uniref:Uncharacterized protein n=1 Tax=Medicago truncatula TaxID=3880 RepID=A2Q1S5_MEDTR|nr:hypothetical protein MtrDRAFT_AC149039g13v2 [Medicago truncatula]AES77724.1 hypothetical protein MTR_7g016450 [Medicago truncatula]RHN44495.1 hypothetical protein MtrunA17_Chr7g0220041 [Medicago truncatula]